MIHRLEVQFNNKRGDSVYSRLQTCLHLPRGFESGQTRDNLIAAIVKAARAILDVYAGEITKVQAQTQAVYTMFPKDPNGNEDSGVICISADSVITSAADVTAINNAKALVRDACLQILSEDKWTAFTNTWDSNAVGYVNSFKFTISK